MVIPENSKSNVLEMDESQSVIDNVDSSDEDEPLPQNNSAWADAISKVLQTNVSKSKHFVLSKAKKDSDIKEKKLKTDVEVVNDDGQVVETIEKPDCRSKQLKERRKEMLLRQQKKHLWENMCRLKPDVTSKEKERTLMRIATKGVVHLFNAVEKHQKSKKQKSEKTKKKGTTLTASKGAFMDMLRGAQPISTENTVTPKEESWSALKDDFMMGTSLKDWDKESDDNET